MVVSISVHEREQGKAVIFDMDMSSGYFVSRIYLLKAPRKVMDLKVSKKTLNQNLLKAMMLCSFTSNFLIEVTLQTHSRFFLINGNG